VLTILAPGFSGFFRVSSRSGKIAEGEQHECTNRYQRRIVCENPSGIVIPDSAKEKPIQGEVLAVGHGKILEDGKVRPLDVKVGDKILFGKYSGTEVKVGNEELLVMREEDIMGVVEK
jgi:chaperonin GroES